MRKKIIFAWTFLLATMMMAGIATATPIDNLSVSDYGSNFITWEWDFNESSTTAIFIDGVKKVNETSLGYFTLSNLNPCESHTITLVNTTNASDIYAMNSQQTFYPPYIFAILLIFMLIFLILSLSLQDSVKVIIFGTMSFVLGLFLYRMSYPYQYSLIAYPCLAFSVLAVIWVMIATISLFSKTASSESWEDEKI